MSYFVDNYASFSYPLQEGAKPGFRKAQLGAIHSAAGHFSNRSEPGIITMPTGSGKTAVLIATAFVLRANRVLVITPSRLVREQIAEEFRTLKTLKDAESLTALSPVPAVLSTQHRVTSNEQWEAMREFDVVVATVQSISPEFEAIPEPPSDLFDLVLVDEGHHSPARTWQTVLEHFASAKRLLFTATPFRQDQKEIKGRFIFTYDLRDAYTDGVFGEIAYKPVTPEENQSHDEAIAKAAEGQLDADRLAGFKHRLMVRTDGLPRAKELDTIYAASTSLRLKIITGSTALSTVKKTIQQLEVGSLDGIICVNMLGEGFNFPSLKIAAIHAPHKSLTVTLQFVGRFARTTGDSLGPATFLAIPSDIEIEAERLYDSKAVWQEMIQNLAAIRVSQETNNREVLESFTARSVDSDLSDLSLHALTPYYHVKIYQLDTNIDLEKEVTFPDRFQVVYYGVSLPHSAIVYITREITLPRWTDDDRLSSVESDLFVFYFDSTTKLLFVCASRRSSGTYDELVKNFADSNPCMLPLFRLNKALNNLTEAEFFNVGMRNRVISNSTESYRIISGPNADRSVQKSDGRIYHRGHAFGRAKEDGAAITIGLSSASKIWSNTSSRLPDLIEWCASLARKISSDRIPVTNSGLDNLDVGEELESLPADIVAVGWRNTVYSKSIVVTIANRDGSARRIPLVDFDLAIDHTATTPGSLMLELSHPLVSFRFTYSFDTARFLEPATEDEPTLSIEGDKGSVALINFLNDEMPLFYTSDLSLIDNYSLFRNTPSSFLPFDAAVMEVVDWTSGKVDIQCEFEQAQAGKKSIHAYLEETLSASDVDVAYYDHGTGEIADFITFKENGGRLLVRFYHCKKSRSATPGHRLDAISDLAGQTVKSAVWAAKPRILPTIRRRFLENIGAHRFLRGDITALEAILARTNSSSMDYEFCAVQPGLEKASLNAPLAHILAAANDYLVRAGFNPLRLMCS